MKRRISIMVPAFNEEGNLEGATNEILSGLKNAVDDFEILIFNDGSKDKTGEIADKLSKKNKKIRVFHNKESMGMGYSYIKGQELAHFEYYMYIPGDDEFPSEALKKMLRQLGKKDIIIPYVTNMHIRPISRQIISKAFTHLINLLFGLNIKYFNGTVIHKTDLLKKVPQDPDTGHAYQAAILVRLIKSGASYCEVGYKMVERTTGSSSALKLKNIKRVSKTLSNLFIDMNIKKELPNLH